MGSESLLVMVDQRRVLCPENQGLADYVLQKQEEHEGKPKGLSGYQKRTFVKAYRNICDAKDSIDYLKDLSKIKYVSCFLFWIFGFVGIVVFLGFLLFLLSYGLKISPLFNF